jgi:hypothetical protein
MKICSPEKSHISRGKRPRELWLFRGSTNFHISLMQWKWMLYSTSLELSLLTWPKRYTGCCISEYEFLIDLQNQYTFIACWWGKYENVFTQEYHSHKLYSWVNTFSYVLDPHAINILLYRRKSRKHIHVKYCWQTYFKFIETLSQTFINHIHKCTRKIVP